MGTLADKLTYLSDTKVAIRDAIRQAGGDVPTGTTFREYADIIADSFQIERLPLYLDNNAGFTESVSNALPGQNSTFYSAYSTVKQGYGIISGINTSDTAADTFVYVYNESTKTATSLSVGARRSQILIDWETGKPINIGGEVFLPCSQPFSSNNILSKLNVSDLSTVTNVTTPISASISNMGIINNGNVYMLPHHTGFAAMPNAQVFKYNPTTNTVTQIMYNTAINTAFGSTADDRFNYLSPLLGITDKCLAFAYNGTTFCICQLDLTTANSISNPVLLNNIGGISGSHIPIVTDKYIYLFPAANIGGTGNLTVVRIKRDQEFSASSYDTVTFTAVGSAGTVRPTLSYGFFRQVSMKNSLGTSVCSNSLFIPQNCFTIGNTPKTIAVDAVKHEFSIISFSSQGLYTGTDRSGGAYEPAEDYCGYHGFGEDQATYQPILLSYWRASDQSSHNNFFVRNTTVMWHTKFS